MPRPRKCRRIEGCPRASYFKPQGIPLTELVETYLSMDGFEALRLADRLGGHLHDIHSLYIKEKFYQSLPEQDKKWIDEAAKRSAEKQAERLGGVVDAQRGPLGVRRRNARDERRLRRFEHVEGDEEQEEPERQRQ